MLPEKSRTFVAAVAGMANSSGVRKSARSIKSLPRGQSPKWSSQDACQPLQTLMPIKRRSIPPRSSARNLNICKPHRLFHPKRPQNPNPLRQSTPWNRPPKAPSLPSRGRWPRLHVAAEPCQRIRRIQPLRPAFQLIPPQQAPCPAWARRRKRQPSKLDHGHGAFRAAIMGPVRSSPMRSPFMGRTQASIRR